jgi:hypothetical protein
MSLKFSVNGISQHLNNMIDRSRAIDGWLNRVAYPAIIKAQRVRWQSEGESEGETWTPLNPRYARQKLKRYRDYPGQGRKMLIATGALIASMTGDDQSKHFKLVGNQRLEVGTMLGYAGYVDDVRDITTLSQATLDDLADNLGDYLTGGVFKPTRLR